MELWEHDLSLSGNDLLHIIDFLDMSICLRKYSSSVLLFDGDTNSSSYVEGLIFSPVNDGH